MDSDLNILFTKVTSQIKLCKCGLSANDVVNTNLVPSFSTILENGIDNQFRSMPVEEEEDSEIGKKIGIPERILINTTCPNCNANISLQEKEIVQKMQNVFFQLIHETGIDFKSLLLPRTTEDLDTSENSVYQIKCDSKYLKRNAKGETLLHTAARKKDIQSVITMLKNEVNPNTQDNAGWTPLHEAVFDDNFEIALELLLAGAIVSVPGYDFTTPLHIATHHNNLQMVKLLLKFGANPLARDISGRCPEFYAKNTDIISTLNEYSGSNLTNVIEMAKRFQKKSAPRPVVIYLIAEDTISADEQHHLETELDITFSKYLDKAVTHVIVEHTEDNVCEPTYDVMKAILYGCVIVNKNWLFACDSRNELVNFSEYEVNGTTKHPTENGPRKARKNFLNLNPPLFTGCHFFVKRTMNYQLKHLVIASGAKMLNREPNPEHAPANYSLFHCPAGHSMENTTTMILYDEGSKEPKLKYNMKHIKSLPIEWFFDCIQTFTIKEPVLTVET